MVDEAENLRCVTAGDLDIRLRRMSEPTLCPIEDSECPEMMEARHTGGLSSCSKSCHYETCDTYISEIMQIGRGE